MNFEKDPIKEKEHAARGKRYLTNEDLVKLEACFELKMLSPFEKTFLDNFKERFHQWGMKATIFSKQEKILDDMYRRIKK